MARWRQTTSSRICAGRLVLVERARDGLDRAGRDLVALDDQLRELVDDRGGGVDRLGLAVERQHVAAQEHVAVQMSLQRPQDGVLAAGELGGDRVVELDLLTHPPCPVYACRASRTRADARLPSARPPAFAITTFITWPMSLGSLAPVSAIAAGDDRVELGVVELGGQVALDEPGLGLLALGQLGPAAVAELLGRLEAALALAPQDRQLVAVALLVRPSAARTAPAAARRRGPSRRPSSRWSCRSCTCSMTLTPVRIAPGPPATGSGCRPRGAPGSSRSHDLAARRRRPPAGSSGCSRRCSRSTGCRRPCRRAPARGPPSLAVRWCRERTSERPRSACERRFFSCGRDAVAQPLGDACPGAASTRTCGPA